MAAEFALPILEDDPYGSLQLRRRRPALRSRALPDAEGALHLGTVSKILAPGLRVAWIVARDRAMYDRLVVAKQSCDLRHPPLDPKRIVAHYVAMPGRLAAQSLLGSIGAYRELRRSAMLEALARTLPAGSSCWTKPEGGLFYGRLPAGCDTTALLPAAIAARVAFVPGAPFWIGRDERATLRLNFSNASPERIATGVERLSRIFRA